MKVELIKKIKETSDTTSFIFKPEKSITWQAGQYIYYTIKHKNPDNRGETRHFTISTAPHEKNIMLTTKFPDNKTSTFKQALNKLKPKDQIEAYSIEGDFTIKNPEKKYVFIAGGIGITPYRSIITDLLYKNKLKEIILIYANKNKDMVFKKELDTLTKKHPSLTTHYIIEPKRINQETLKEKIRNLNEYTHYISGTESMVNSIKEILKKTALKENQIKTDFFPGYNTKY